MKKIISYLSLSCVLGISAIKAQEINSFKSAFDKKKFYIGMKQSMGIANISGLKKPSGDSKISPIFSHASGLYGGYKLNDAFSLQAELLASQQGVCIESKNDDSKIYSKATYLSIPFLGQYTFPSGVYIEAGPQFSFLAASSINLTNHPEFREGTVSYNFNNEKSPFNTFDLGLALGAGYHFNERWNANLRYTQGLSKVFKDVKESTKNSQFQVGVGYTF